MKFILYLSVLAVGAAGQSLTINTPIFGAAECQPQLITWFGGTPPYFPSVQTYPLSETPVANFGAQLTNQITWMVKVPLGTSLVYMIKDSTGRIAYSAPFTVTSGSGNSCIGTGSTPGGSAGSDPTIGVSTAVRSTLPASKFMSPASSASSVSSASPTNTMSLPASPKKINLTWPIAGVVGGLLLVLAEVGFLYWRARCRRQSVGFVDGLDGVEKQPSVYRLPTALAAQDESARAQLYSAVPSGKIQLSLPNQAVPRGILVAEETERCMAVQRMDEEIRGLTKQAEREGQSELLDSEVAEGSSECV